MDWRGMQTSKEAPAAEDSRNHLVKDAVIL